MQSLQAYNVAYNAPADHYVAIEMMLFIYFLLFYLQRNLNIFNRSSGVAYLGYIGAQSGLQFCRPKKEARCPMLPYSPHFFAVLFAAPSRLPLGRSAPPPSSLRYVTELFTSI